MMDERNLDAEIEGERPGQASEESPSKTADTTASSLEVLESEQPSAVAPAAPSLEAQAAKAAEYWDKFLRATADLENFKKRVARERADQAKYAQTSLLLNLIPVLDNLDMAMAAVETSKESAATSLQQGVAMVLQQFKTALKGAGLEEIDATGQLFDPNLHEAVSQLETQDAPEGSVVQQLRKGYRLHDRLLRPASVVVAAKPAAKNPARGSSSELDSED